MGFLEKIQQKKHIDKTNDDKTIIADEEYRVEKDREKDQIDKTEEERITSTIDEINEGQEGKTGLLAKFGDIKDLSEKVRLLLSDENLCRNLACNAYEYVKENHDWTKLVDRYIELYQGCVLDS